jgi:AbiV family abortive infection protein
MIPHEELARGIKLCRKNVNSLLGDARTLYRKKSFGHAMTLAIVALEEFAKEIILIKQELYPRAFDSEVRDAFVNHRFKIAYGLDWLAREIRQRFPESPTAEEIDEVTEELTKTRSSCLYVDFLKSSGWYDPNAPDLKDLARMTIDNVKLLTQISDRQILAVMPGLKLARKRPRKR